MATTLLQLPDAVRQRMVADCDGQRPDEACGMLIGVHGPGGPVVRATVPLANVWPEPAERPTRYAVDPLQQMRVERQATADGMDVVGFYHSHPTGVPVPSGVDLGLAWPGYCYLIVGFAPAATVRAWVLDDAGAQFVECTIESAG